VAAIGAWGEDDPAPGDAVPPTAPEASPQALRPARKGNSPRPATRGESLFFGGAGRDRTDDLSSAIAALSQLSYGPRIVAPFRDRPSGLSRRPKATVA
jgi:hypothetical protein